MNSFTSIEMLLLINNKKISAKSNHMDNDVVVVVSSSFAALLMLSIAFANVLDPMGTFVFVATWINPERFATEVGLSLAVPLLLSSLMYKKIVPSITKLLGFDITKTTIAIWLAMSPTCRRHIDPTAKCLHFLATQPCHAETKLIPTDTMAGIYPSSFCTRVCMHNLPKTSTLHM